MVKFFVIGGSSFLPETLQKLFLLLFSLLLFYPFLRFLAGYLFPVFLPGFECCRWLIVFLNSPDQPGSRIFNWPTTSGLQPVNAGCTPVDPWCLSEWLNGQTSCSQMRTQKPAAAIAFPPFVWHSRLARALGYPKEQLDIPKSIGMSRSHLRPSPDQPLHKPEVCSCLRFRSLEDNNGFAGNVSDDTYPSSHLAGAAAC